MTRLEPKRQFRKEAIDLIRAAQHDEFALQLEMMRRIARFVDGKPTHDA